MLIFSYISVQKVECLLSSNSIGRVARSVNIDSPTPRRAATCLRILECRRYPHAKKSHGGMTRKYRQRVRLLGALLRDPPLHHLIPRSARPFSFHSLHLLRSAVGSTFGKCCLPLERASAERTVSLFVSFLPSVDPSEMMLQYLDPLPRFLTHSAFSPPSSLQDAIAAVRCPNVKKRTNSPAFGLISR